VFSRTAPIIGRPLEASASEFDTAQRGYAPATVMDNKARFDEGAGRLQALDLLRLVAVLGVVLFHYGFSGPAGTDVTATALPELSSFARYGFLGVPVFFVISGFVIAYSAEDRTATGFAIARFARIYPCFIFCMTLTFVTVLLFGPPHFETTLAQWAANLLLASPALRQPYMDSAYWSLVVEATFYGWVAVLIAAGVFRKHIDIIVLAWLCISMLNELTIDARAIEIVFLADDSGFFATGLLIYEFHRGRRDAMLKALLALSVATAIFQAIHNLGWLRGRTGEPFDDCVVAAICLLSILAIIGATRIRSLPIPAPAVLAIGGMTYPMYLLHQQLGYAVFYRVGPVDRPAILVAAIVAAVALLSWAVWRFVERPSQRWTKQTLTALAARLGLAAHSRPAAPSGA
jgi:peptidoglycan/LPS O-acetylase OafA/YrhL